MGIILSEAYLCAIRDDIAPVSIHARIRYVSNPVNKLGVIFENWGFPSNIYQKLNENVPLITENNQINILVYGNCQLNQ